MVGDAVLTPFGEYLEVVEVKGAGDVAEALVEKAIRERKPNLIRHSMMENCVHFGDTTGREKRNHERYKARHMKPQETTV